MKITPANRNRTLVSVVVRDAIALTLDALISNQI